MSFISIKNLSKSHNKTKIIDNLSLEIAKDERIVILGDSGCGKTTLLRLIAGLETPDKGEIRINDALVSQAGKIVVLPEFRELNMVFQELALWPHLSVRENLSFVLNAKKIPKNIQNSQITRMLSSLSILSHADKKPDTLSGGEKQRVAIARALIAKPKILLMDEPLSSLNKKLSLEIQKELITLHKSLNFTLIYVTHSTKEAFNIGTKIVFMNSGKIVFIGNQKEAKEYLNDNN